jgi:hypothetical protein
MSEVGAATGDGVAMNASIDANVGSLAVAISPTGSNAALCTCSLPGTNGRASAKSAAEIAGCARVGVRCGT